MRVLLRQTDIGKAIGESSEYRLLLSAFNFFIPEVLAEIHPEWKYDALDDMIPLVAEKIGEWEALYFGLSYLIRNQCLVPTYIQLQIDHTADRVNWLECRVGERGPQGMLCRSNRSFDKQLYRLQGQEDQIDWAYWVTFGQRH